MRHDIHLVNSAGTVLASYGPRVNVGDCVEECEPKEAGFWGVYRHNSSGHALHVGDTIDEASARTFARLVALNAITRHALAAYSVLED